MIQVVVPRWVDQRGKLTLAAMARGLSRLGLDHKLVTLERAEPSRSPMICWGVYKRRFPQRIPFRDLQSAQRNVGPLIIVERGFVKREDYYMVGFNDINGRANYPHDWDCPDDRWKELGITLKPWGVGEETLIIGQVPWDTSCQHMPHAEWIHGIAKILRNKFKQERIVFRPHPLQPNAVITDSLLVDFIDTGRPLAEAIRAAKMVVTFSSTVGVDATIAGRRCTVSDQTSMVYDLWIQDDKSPERRPWAHWLAYCQWTVKEMEQGKPWKHLFRGGL